MAQALFQDPGRAAPGPCPLCVCLAGSGTEVANSFPDLRMAGVCPCRQVSRNGPYHERSTPMVHRLLSLAVLMVFGGSALVAADKDKAAKADKNTHVGTFVAATAKGFVMKSKGKEHSHTLAA